MMSSIEKKLELLEHRFTAPMDHNHHQTSGTRSGELASLPGGIPSAATASTVAVPQSTTSNQSAGNTTTSTTTTSQHSFGFDTPQFYHYQQHEQRQSSLTMADPLATTTTADGATTTQNVHSNNNDNRNYDDYVHSATSSRGSASSSSPNGITTIMRVRKKRSNSASSSSSTKSSPLSSASSMVSAIDRHIQKVAKAQQAQQAQAQSQAQGTTTTPAITTIASQAVAAPPMITPTLQEHHQQQQQQQQQQPGDGQNSGVVVVSAKKASSPSLPPHVPPISSSGSDNSNPTILTSHVQQQKQQLSTPKTTNAATTTTIQDKKHQEDEGDASMTSMTGPSCTNRSFNKRKPSVPVKRVLMPPTVRGVIHQEQQKQQEQQQMDATSSAKLATRSRSTTTSAVDTPVRPSKRVKATTTSLNTHHQQEESSTNKNSKSPDRRRPSGAEDDRQAPLVATEGASISTPTKKKRNGGKQSRTTGVGAAHDGTAGKVAVSKNTHAKTIDGFFAKKASSSSSTKSDPARTPRASSSNGVARETTTSTTINSGGSGGGGSVNRAAPIVSESTKAKPTAGSPRSDRMSLASSLSTPTKRPKGQRLLQTILSPHPRRDSDGSSSSTTTTANKTIQLTSGVGSSFFSGGSIGMVLEQPRGAPGAAKESVDAELEQLQRKHDELRRQYEDKEEQLRAVTNNRTIMHATLKRALDETKDELSTMKSKHDVAIRATRNVMEELVLSDSAREAVEVRDKLASEGARLGRIVHTRAGMRSVETWEDGYATKQLKKRRLELTDKRRVLEERRQAAMKAREAIVQRTQLGQVMNDDNDSMDVVVPSSQPDTANDDKNNNSFIVGDVEIQTIFDTIEALESVRFHLRCIEEKEMGLAKDEKSLNDEKVKHIRALKRIACEDNSRFRSRPKLHDRYVLKCLLGKGGFSEVWRAFDLEKLREVAVKIHQLDPRWSESKKENYTKHVSREYEIHRNVRHPRIVSLFDVFEIDNNSFATVLECCNGTDLDMMLKERRRLPERDARAILLQILSGMQYLCQPSADGTRQGIIHYDLKPGNILFDEYGDAKITDFGLSKIVDAPDPAESMELTSQGAGTYWYLPPECFVVNENVRISNKVDVWSIGVIFFQMLYGRRPFGDGQTQDSILTDQTMLTAHAVQFPDRPEVSDDGKTFIGTCLTYDQSFRPTIAQICQNPYVLKELRE